MVDRLVRSACLLEEIRLHCAYTYAIHYVTHAAAAGLELSHLQFSRHERTYRIR